MWLKRLAIILIAVELAYLLIFNLALNLQLTQDLINRIKPDKFAVHWDSAWTPFPFQVYASGVSANGQSRSQQWEVSAPRASASISLLPLMTKKVKLNGVKAHDVRYYQRPRPRADKDYSQLRQFFPPITGRELELSPAILAPVKTGKKGWNIRLNDMQASGRTSLWLYQLKADLSGQARADLSLLTRGGPISLRNGELDLNIDSVLINGDREMLSDGGINGSLELTPFVVRENKGLKALTFLNLDINLNSRTESLAFLNTYLNAFEGMKVDGSGEVSGRIVLEQGRLLPESDLSVTADALKLALLKYEIAGDGNIHVKVSPPITSKADADMQFAIAFNSLDAYYADQPSPVLTGNGLVVSGVGSNNIVPLGGDRAKAKSLALSVSSLKVLDLSDFQRFLPKKWAFKLHGGEGELRAKVSIDRTQISSDFKLISEAADVAVNDFRFSSNLEMDLKVNSPDLQSGRIDVSGTSIKISDTQVSREQEQSQPWHASVAIETGIVQLDAKQAGNEAEANHGIVELIKNQEIGHLLATADEELKVKGNISDLRWLNLMFKNPYGLVINGNGEITSNIVIKSGWLEKDTVLSITPQKISVEVLDYIADGQGSVSLNVLEGGEFPDVRLDIQTHDARFRRKQETQAFIEDLDLKLQADARRLDLNGGAENLQLKLTIPSAKIKDMSVYNLYLPENSPLQIKEGEASLVADIMLNPDNASGYIRVNAKHLLADVDEQSIAAELSVDVKLAGGKPEAMTFDISESTVRLDAVKVIGEVASFRDQDWAAELRFKKANTVWKKPLLLDVEAEITMTDSIPLVSMMANQKGKHGWLSKALTIDDVAGDLNFQIANERIIVPYAFATSDNIDVGAKAVIDRETRNGMIFVRYKALKGLLKINDGKRNIDVLKAKQKFDDYSTDEVITIQTKAETKAQAQQ